jgi:predicted dienelactone hydrolase
VNRSRRGTRHVIRLLAVLVPVMLAVPALAIDAPDALGPWKVGHREASVASPPHLPSGATQFFDIWYPVDNVDWVGAFTTYFLSELLFATIELDSTVAKRDVPVSSTGGRGLIVFSHGSGSVAVQSVVLVETLASHGFIVVAPTHYFNNSFDTQNGNSQPFLVTARQRPKEASFSIDYMFGRNQDNLDDFFGSIDETKVGMTGHSFGGFTTYAMASGYTSGFCDTETDSDYGDACTTGAECIATCSVATVPADARVKVLMPVSPAHELLSGTELQSVGLPTLCMAGTIEALSTQCRRPFPLTQASASPNFRVDVIGAAHEAFANTCDFGNALIDAGICASLSDSPPCDDPTADPANYDDPADYDAWASLPGAGALIQPYINVCVVPQIPLAEVVRLQTLYTVSMFRRHLLGETEYDAFLTADYAAAQEPSAIFWPDAFSVPALTAAGLVLLGGLLAGTAARWTRRLSGGG